MLINRVATSFAEGSDGRQLEGPLGSLTLPFDMILRPQFGSQYYNWIQAVSGFWIAFFALWISAGLSAALNWYVGWFYRLPLYSAAFWTIALIFGFGHTIHRIYRLVIRPEDEKDSPSDGPSLPFFDRFAHGKSWAWTRMVYEPVAVSIGATILAVLQILPYFILPYVYACSYALFMRAAITYWNGWKLCREQLDMINQAPILEAIANGAEPPEKLGRAVFSAIPASTPAHQKKAIAMQMVGLTPEMASLLTERR